jgi:hypothetical protein
MGMVQSHIPDNSLRRGVTRSDADDLVGLGWETDNIIRVLARHPAANRTP